MRLTFSTKAGTLAQLQTQLKSARIAPLVLFSVADWRASRVACLAQLSPTVEVGLWIVRSSCHKEDGLTHSHAGAFLSVPNVTEDALENAIEQVITAYGAAVDADEILIQPMLHNVLRSGVAFSHDPNTCSPYRVINWHEGSDTFYVTGGQGGRMWYGAALSPVVPPTELVGVLALLKELLDLFGDVPVDCEFAVTLEEGSEVLWLLQARPMTGHAVYESPQLQKKRLAYIADKVVRGMCPHPFLIGQRTVYGVMPDWNPAEIIGVRPKPLALSLYRELVTDSVWAYQRHNYGYRNLRSFPLMLHFFGLPYIDVRVSFNSFIPADLDDGLAGRLVDHYIDLLLIEPTLHDKVEFDIVLSCYTLDLPQRMVRLSETGFSGKDCENIAESLRRLTNHIIHPKEGLWCVDAAKLDTLNHRREALLASNTDSLERMYWLLEDVKRYGTLPFAGLARAGFVAVQMLRSLVTVGVFSQEDYDAFLASLSMVSGQLVRDRAILDKTTFLSRYGHLRPGTYDILSPRYDEAPDLYFDWTKRSSMPEPAKPFSLTLPQMREIGQLLNAHGLHIHGMELFDFLQAGIELRETAKFYFTRNLSDILSLVGHYGEQWGFTREDMAFCDITIMREIYMAAADSRSLLAHSIDQGKARYRETLSVALPPLITSPEEVWGFEWPITAPNFITQKEVVARVSGYENRDLVSGAIVCIPSADPGFDWLFAYPIAGLITAWGGANSHMAIRASELGLPSVIGAGELLYRTWSQAHRLHINCAGRRVEVLA